MKKKLHIICAFIVIVAGFTVHGSSIKTHDLQRAAQVKELKFGMFICWSFSTFSGMEWTRGATNTAFFKATGCDTDQWCKTAKQAGMNYILFLTKHHDGFCLWDTKTTDWKVTKSPLGIDVLAKLVDSCEKYGIKLSLYFSEGDWTWIKGKTPKDGIIRKSKAGRDPIWRTGNNAELKKAQLEELCTQYGPIEFFWMDHAQGDGGLGHKETVEWVSKFQPDCFVGFNSGSPAGRLSIRERGRPGPIGSKNVHKYKSHLQTNYKSYLVAEFTYPILPKHKGGAMWFYSLPEHDNLCHTAEKIYRDYLGALKYENIFSLDVGPDYNGKLRDIDIKTLQKIGKYIRGELKFDELLPIKIDSIKASSTWNSDYGPEKAADSLDTTRWGAGKGSENGWLEIDFGEEVEVNRLLIDEAGYNRIRKYRLQVKINNTWKTFLSGKELKRIYKKFQTVKGRYFRLEIIEASGTPTISRFEFYYE